MPQHITDQLIESMARLLQRGEAEHPEIKPPTKLTEIKPQLDQYRALVQAGEYREAYAQLNKPVEPQAEGKAVSLLDKLSRLSEEETQREMVQLLTPTAAASLEPDELDKLLEKFRAEEPLMPTARKIANRAAICIRLLPLLEQRGDDLGLFEALSAIVHDYRRNEQSKLALEYQERLTKVAERRGDREEIICELMEQARLHTTLKQPAAAAAQLAKIDQMLAEAANPSEKIKIIGEIIPCDSFFSANPWVTAHRHSLIELAPQADLSRLDAEALGWVVNEFLDQERYADALPYQLHRIGLIEQDEKQGDLYESLDDLTTTYEKLERNEDALKSLDRLFVDATKLQRPDLQTGVLSYIVDKLIEWDRADEAQTYRERLVKLTESIGAIKPL